VNKFKYFTVTNTTLVTAPAVKEAKKLPPFVQAAITKKNKSKRCTK